MGDTCHPRRFAYKPNTSQSTTCTTSFSYNALGQLQTACISDGNCVDTWECW